MHLKIYDGLLITWAISYLLHLSLHCFIAPKSTENCRIYSDDDGWNNFLRCLSLFLTNQHLKTTPTICTVAINFTVVHWWLSMSGAVSSHTLVGVVYKNKYFLHLSAMRQREFLSPSSIQTRRRTKRMAEGTTEWTTVQTIGAEFVVQNANIYDLSVAWNAATAADHWILVIKLNNETLTFPLSSL